MTIRVPVLCFLVLFLTAPNHAQVKVNYGEVAGTVTDPSGEPIANAPVRVSDTARGLKRETQTDENGQYRVTLLPPSRYLIAFESPGYVSESLTDAEVPVGDTLVVNAVLTAGPETIRVDVVAKAPAVDLARTQQSTTLSSKQIDSLPINRRNYLDFALLSPGVVETTTLADGTDYRVANAPSSGLGIGGGNGRGNVFAVDGFDNNNAYGTARPSVAQVAVQEFQVNRNSYSAEYGGGYGGVFNIVSKSGTNDLHGEVFGFLRNRALDARNYFDYFDPRKSGFTRVQYGAGVGGRLWKDRTFYFFGFERLDRQETVFVPILTDRTSLSRLKPSQTQLLTFLDTSNSPDLRSLSGTLRVLLTPTNNPAVLPLFLANSGNFPFSGHATQASFRIDHRFSDRNSLFLRLNRTDDQEENTKFGALVGFSRGSSQDLIDRTVAAQHTLLLSPRWTTVTRGAVSYSRANLQPRDPFGPALDISGFGSFGRDPLLPTDSWFRRGQIQNITSRVSTRHALKFGVDILPTSNHARFETYFSGRFIFGEFLPLGLVLNGATQNPQFASQLADTLSALGRPDLVPGLADPLNSLQAFSLGLPIAYVQGFGNPFSTIRQRRFSSFIEDSYRPKPGLTLTAGLREQYDSTKDIPTMHNIDPRVSFAWSPGGTATFVIRGGYGLFHNFIESYIPFSATAFQRPDLNVLFISLVGVPGILNPETKRPVTSADIYASLLARGILGRRAVQYQDLTQLGVGPALRFPTTGGVANDFVAAYTEQASFELEHSVGDFAVSAGYNFSRGVHLPRTRDRNLYVSGRRPNGAPVFGRIDPTINNNFVLESAANSFYHALILRVDRRFLTHYSVTAHYTFSKAIDEVTDFNNDYTPNDQLNARADRGLSPFHQQHRFVAHAILESPYRAAPTLGWRDRLLGDWTFSPTVRANSSRPFNVLSGFDNLGDGQVNTHRPWPLGRDTGI